MKHRSIILTLFFSLISILFFGCNSILGIFGSNNIVDVDIPEIPTGYTKVYLGVCIEGNIIQSNDFSLEIEANENLVEYLIYETEADKLKIYLNEKYRYNNVKIQANITMPSIVELEANDSTDVNLQNFNEDTLLINVGSSSDLTSSDLTVDELIIRGDSSSNIKLSSITVNSILDIVAGSSSDLTSSDLTMDELIIRGDSSSNIKLSSITVNTILDIVAGSSSYFRIQGSGNPDLILDAESSSDINLRELMIGDADIDLGSSSFGEITMNNGTLNANLGSSSTLKVHGDYLEGDVNIGSSADLINE